MEKRELQKLLNQPYNKDNWKQIVQFVFPNVSVLANPTEFSVSNDKIKKFSQIGNVRLNDGKNLALFELILAENVNIQRNRVELNNEISKYIDQEQIHGVLSVFEQGGDDYRFTFSAKSTEFDDVESDFIQKRTDTKRYTYVLGKNESCKTPADRFYSLSQSKEAADILSIQRAFSVETLSKEFFNEYKKQFEKFWKYLAENKDYSKTFDANEPEKRQIKIRDFTKKLLGRIVFLHFLQKKGWLGCPNKDNWGGGDKQFMSNLFSHYSDKEHFHSICLYELFYNNLNLKRVEDTLILTNIPTVFNNTKAPYLNGGLFDSDQVETKEIDFPVDYFQDLLDFFSQYNFTIDENDPNDHEVGIDPEMLGHIFENLLEDNKDKGAFYTPKNIVLYMCQESIIEFLNVKVNPSNDLRVNQALIDLVREKFAEQVSDLDLIEEICESLYRVKICDPAIGSGAFPMGILNVIHNIIEILHDVQPDTVSRVWGLSDSDWDPHIVKKNIIQRCIYGVDIEEGAVDIARLRFWLALVVDENAPTPLPNLDYKIMQGNSLLENFEGVDLSSFHDPKSFRTNSNNDQINLFSEDNQNKNSLSIEFANIQALMNEYFISNNPQEKKDLHRKIDEQIISHIRFTLSKDKQEKISRKNELEKRIRVLQGLVSSNTQKEKISNNSKEAKELKKLNTTLEEYDVKERRLSKLTISNERPFFLWRLFFKDVFDDGGFDIVIGNPPYLSNKGVSLEIKDEFGFKDDLYNYFFIKSNELLCAEGILCFITSNTFLTLQSKKNVRELLLKNEIKQIVNLGHDIFHSAMVATAISIYKKIELNGGNGIIKYIDSRGKTNFHEGLVYHVNQKNYLNSPNQVFYSPNRYNTEIYELYAERISTLLEDYWDQVSTSRSISKHRKQISEFQKTLRPGDLTILGLLTDGGQGLATGNNGDFVGVIEGSKESERIKQTRIKKIREFNNKHGQSFDITDYSEFRIRELFDELKKSFGRDVFGQGYLYQIVDESEIADLNTITDKEKANGISGKKVFVPYDKGDKDGNRWYLKTPYYINWSTEKVSDLKARSHMNGRGKSLWQNSQFYFRDGFCWSDIHTVLIKTRLKGISVHDVTGMSLFPTTDLISSKYIVCIMNSKFTSEYSFEFQNNTSHFQINDARALPIIIPNDQELNFFESLFDEAMSIQLAKFENKLSETSANDKLEIVQIKLDEAVNKLYKLNSN